MKSEVQRLAEEFEGEIRLCTLNPVHLIPDLVRFGLAREVYVHANAVLLLLDSDVPGAVYPNARATFEAAEDLCLLIAREDYDWWGGRAYVAELLDQQHSRGLAGKASTSMGKPHAILPFDDIDSVVRAEGDEWETHSGGKRELLLRALNAVRDARAAKPPRWHWSALTRAEIHSEVAAFAGEPPTSELILKSWYNLLSFLAHPSPRLSPNQVEQQPDGSYAFLVTPEDREDLSGLGGVATETALHIAIRALRHWRGEQLA